MIDPLLTRAQVEEPALPQPDWLTEAEAAYRRGALLDKRRELMEAWATFLARPPSPA